MTGTGESVFTDTAEQRALRAAVHEVGRRYGLEYYLRCCREHHYPVELLREMGGMGYLGVSLPAEYGGGGAGLQELVIVVEELGAAGCPVFLIAGTPAVCGSIIAAFGTPEQKRCWLPGFADGTIQMAFAITEPDAGSNLHRITTTARRDGRDWLLRGRKVYTSGVDAAEAVLVVGRADDAGGESLELGLFIVPRDALGFTYRSIEMDVTIPERQFQLFFDDVRLPDDARVGGPGAGLTPVFAGLNPERILTAAYCTGISRYVLGRAVDYACQREVWGVPIGAHQGIAHPLAQITVEVDLARLMLQKAAYVYDTGDAWGAVEPANMAKYAAAEAAVRAVDQAVQTHGGNGLTTEYGLAALLSAARMARIIPVSREMLLNDVARRSLGLPKSY